jgi:pilus assembly protein CpaB
MNNRAVTLSVVMAVMAMFFIHSYVSTIEEEAQKKYGTSLLVVKAKQDIKEQETINETLLEFGVVPKKFLEPAAVFFEKVKEDQDTARGLKSLVGAVAAVPIKKGEQITYSKITEPGVRTGLSPQVTPGKRAVAVPVSDVTGVSKLIKPGDRVDLIAVLDVGGGRENRIVKTIFQDVVVLSVGRNVTNNNARVIEADSFGGKERVRSLTEDTSFTSVTLEVEPTQAQMVALILANGENSVNLALRNNDDTERMSGLAPMNLSEVLGTDVSRFQRSLSGKR